MHINCNAIQPQCIWNIGIFWLSCFFDAHEMWFFITALRVVTLPHMQNKISLESCSVCLDIVAWCHKELLVWLQLRMWVPDWKKKERFYLWDTKHFLMPTFVVWTLNNCSFSLSTGFPFPQFTLNDLLSCTQTMNDSFLHYLALTRDTN